MKLIKKLFVFSTISMVPIFSVVACSTSHKNNNYENLKRMLNSFINEYAFNDTFGISQIKLKPIYSTDQNNSSELNLFTILEDYEILNNVFDFDPQYTSYDDNRYNIQYSFSNVVDSYGNSAKILLDETYQTLTIPVLITMVDSINGNSVSKYVNFITLDIIDKEVNSSNEENNKYNGSPGKALRYNGVEFQSIPKIMIDKYLDFYAFSMSSNFKKAVRYVESTLDKWEGKTLTEVYGLSGAILSPLNQTYGNNEYSYSISSSTFWQDDFKYARFFIKVTIVNRGDSNILDDANNIYNLSFTKEYTYVDKRWEFAYPSSSEISTFVSNNDSIGTELINTANQSINLYVPFVNISQLEANNIGVVGIVNRFEKARDFLPPESFEYLVLDDDIRKISFEIASLETVENEENVVQINMKLKVGEGILQATKDFSKKFNIKSWNFV